ncbi:MAG: histidine kinase [Chitinophagales bacterium]|nr:histidine kinase [Chitinophagales bacterium]
MKFINLFLLSFSIVLYASGQDAAVYNINKNNGLSTNHVYTTLVDKNGYLWIATEEGVYKYNGYVLRKFDYTDGLSNLDIWDLYQDRKGRIWLCSISNHFGYIHNNFYRNVNIEAPENMPVIYPSQIFEYGDSLVFMNKASTQTNYSSLSIIVDDTLHRKLIADHISEIYRSNINNLGSGFIEILDDKIFQVSSADYINTPNRHSYQPNTQKICTINIQKQLQSSSFCGSFANRFIYYLDRNLNTVCIYDYVQNNIDTILLKGRKGNLEAAVHMYVSDTLAVILSASAVYLLDSQLLITQRIDLDSLYGTERHYNINNTYFSRNPFWGSMLSTANKGLYISYMSNREYLKKSIDLDDYKYVGKANDSTGFWWNKQTHTLQLLCSGKTTKTFILEDIPDVNKIIPFNDSKYILLNNRKSGWLFKNGNVVSLIDGFEYIAFRNKITHLSNDSFQITKGVLDYSADCARIDSNAIYMVGLSYNGLNQVTYEQSSNTIRIDSIYFDKYTHISYNAHNKIAILYTSDRVMIINRGVNRNILINNDQLHTLGVNGIEKILSDDFGNIFIKDYNKLIVANIFTKQIRLLFNAYQLEGALIDLDDNVLSLAGSFGVIRSHVTGPCNVSDVNSYLNTKHIFYDFVDDAQFSKNNVLLKTNKGAYLINTNNDKEISKFESEYKVTLNYDTTLISIYGNDTISIDQSVNSIFVDIIRPAGTGELKIEYSINGSSLTNTGYQVILPNPEPGNYNTIYLKASDDSWKSEPMKFFIYIKPHWWQTHVAKKIIFSGVVLFIICLIYIAVLITRKIVNKNNERRNQRRELELKSIYSQINPHFIFNSLSTAQYFVKKNKNKEAYEHINQFSDLLRSYIKSSRNTYITITEEIENLENYLQLQQTRFEEKFDYTITVDKTIKPDIVKLPSLLLQPIVENALNHGIFHKDQKGLLNISFTIDKKILICVVDDNGIGRTRSKEIRSERIKKADSYGTILIKDLIDTFNKYEKIRIGIEYVDKTEPDTGTTVIIKIENLNNV